MLAFLGAAMPVAWAARAAADPQASATFDVGVAATGSRGDVSDRGELFLGLRGDVILGRQGPRDFGAGPFRAVGSFAVDSIELGGGAAALLPVHETFPLVASVGAAVRADGELGVEPAVLAKVFWGTRSYNFHGAYGMSAGVSCGFHQTLGASKTSALLVAAELDLAVMALPIVALVNLVRGPTAEAAAP